jgi:hypothetical protein
VIGNPGMPTDSIDDSSQLVKGCPCYREFGDEKVCLNNDSILPINAISVDPSFFNQLDSKVMLEDYKSNNKSMCYLLMFLDRSEGFCYCVSQNQRVRISNKDVRVTEIDNALQFVTTSERNRDGMLCSDCLYRYLRTLGESSEGFLTDDERNEIIATYVQELATNMAIQLSGYGESDKSVPFNDYLWNYLREINRKRSHWASMILNMIKAGANDDLVELIDSYRTLASLESVFLFQVLSLDDSSNETDSLSVLRFMVGVSEKVITVNNLIRERTNDLMERNELPSNVREMLSHHSEARKTTEYNFSNLVSALHKMDTYTT